MPSRPTSGFGSPEKLNNQPGVEIYFWCSFDRTRFFFSFSILQPFTVSLAFWSGIEIVISYGSHVSRGQIHRSTINQAQAAPFLQLNPFTSPFSLRSSPSIMSSHFSPFCKVASSVVDRIRGLDIIRLIDKVRGRKGGLWIFWKGIWELWKMDSVWQQLCPQQRAI